MPDFKMKDETMRLWKNKYKENGGGSMTKMMTPTFLL